ncbi:MAG: autophagy- protein 2, partial [Watsoniomyces obsoletus]
MSSALASVRISQDEATQTQHLDVEFKNSLLFLETCADSTQTLIQILNGLSPPAPPSTKAKFRTEIVPIEDMLASFTGNAFVSEPGPEMGLQASQVTHTSSGRDEEYEEDEYDDGGFMNEMYGEEKETDDEMTASYVESDLA